jgi:autophagy-related protein 9
MNVLRSNEGAGDKMHDREDSDDDEVPQSFMIETTQKPGASKGKQRDDGTVGSGSRKPLHSVARRKASTQNPGPGLPMPVSIPPRPSEVDDSDRTPRTSNFEQKSTSPNSSNTRRTAFSGGLNDEQKAMWNWHNNIYNLDAFLQEIYAYYEGKGIYSIALSKGLNLL